MEEKIKTLITLTKDQQDLFQANGHIINDGYSYYNLPQWYKETIHPNKFEVLDPGQLPEHLKRHVNGIRSTEILDAAWRMANDGDSGFAASLIKMIEVGYTAEQMVIELMRMGNDLSIKFKKVIEAWPLQNAKFPIY